MEQKRILIPNGGISEWALINAAHRMGMYVITSGIHEDAPANRIADEYVKADYSDKEAMLRLAKEKKIDYMASNAHDLGMLSTSYVCEQLGLPGHDSYETTRTLHTKSLLKPLCKKLGIHTPIAEVFTDREEALSYVRQQLTEGKQIILKPADNAASVGVVAPKTLAEAEAAVNLSFDKSRSHTVVIEPFLEGFFVTCTSMIIDQKVEAFFADAALFYPQGEVVGPQFPMNKRGNGGMLPAPFMDEWEDYIVEDFNKIAKELKLVNGKFHAELMICPDHSAHIFDLHRRYSGFPDPYPEWNDTVSMRWEDWVLRAQCGMDLSGFPKGIRQDKFFHYRNIYAPRNGKLKKMELDSYLTSLIVPMWEARNFTVENVEVTDYMHQPLANLRFRLNSYEEAQFLSDAVNDHFYNHVTFEYED